MALIPESEGSELIDEGELEKLESEVTEMAQKVSEYRKTLPEHLRNTLDSALSSSSHTFPNIASGSDPQLPSSSNRLTISAGTEEQECEQKMIQLKEIMSRNAQNIPKVVKRVREFTHKLDSLDGRRTIHPAFTRRRLN
ncbi:unnamed protein product [Eruca vesicaria subsp. sativa]|uniref:Uncharacterized protein n=1 Tax=Eruca vesicaria subsp. sativa TaxID=29727 RepID=A0ABC8L7C4_ERUVS|nr:unnamed protein product [Eruca vesicaria subsp. sativa]